LRTLSALRFRALVFSLACAVLSSFAAAPQAHANSKYAGIVLDAKTGRTLYAYRADSLRYPASLTKMMTMYMMFEALETGKLHKSTRIRMSRYAASKPPSKLGIKPGRTIKAEHAIMALATKSANDVAAAVAEHLGGSESNFGRMMTAKARKLGMKNTTFRNASGLTSKGQLTTARDMARLGIALREHFPQHYKYFSVRNFSYGKANYRNHNRLLRSGIRGYDGIKTGYTRASGFNLVSSVQSNGRSIVAVVMGGRSGKSRNAQMAKLISRHMKKASRGKKRRLIAKRGTTSFAIASLPKSGPPPAFRPVQLASNDVAPATASVPIDRPIPASAPRQDFNQESVIARLAAATPPTPSGRQQTVRAYVDPSQTASVPRPVKQIEKVAKAPEPTAKFKPEGWVIQVGATDSMDSAQALIGKVRKKANGVLAQRKHYTEPVEKGADTLYRARFAGFSNKQQARQACKSLKKRRLACLAVPAA